MTSWIELDPDDDTDLDEHPPDARRPGSVEEMEALAAEMLALGIDRVVVDGDDWELESWGVGPEWLPEHPLYEQHASGRGGDGFRDDHDWEHGHIGDHWFHFNGNDGLWNHAGRFDTVEAFHAAIGWQPDPLADVFDDLGIAGDPDQVRPFRRLGDHNVRRLAAACEDLVEVVAQLERDEATPEEVDDVLTVDDGRELGDADILGRLALRRAGIDLGRLPVGDETDARTAAAVLAESSRRAVPPSTVLAERIAASARWAELAPLYEGAEALVQIDGRSVPAAEAWATIGDHAIITACNPMSVELSDAENAARHAELLDELDRWPHRTNWWSTVGRSPDGSWEEPGVAVPYQHWIVTHQAPSYALANRFGQAAIYVVTEDGIRVERLVGAR